VKKIMIDKHIIQLLDADRFGSLNEPDTLRVEAHIDECSACQEAHAAARAAAKILQARSVETIEPSPFFSTRVVALVREQQNAPAAGLATMWKAARGFLLSAVSVVVLLAGLTFLIPQSGASEPALAFWQPSYSTEGVVFDDDVSNSDESPTSDQVGDVVFTAEEPDAGNQR
jgi:anti-sigma factor RsiW